MKGDICKIEECVTKVRTGTICEVHAWRMRKYGSYQKPIRKKFGEECQIDGCKKLRYGRNSICGMHKTRFERYASYDLPVRISPSLPEGIVKLCTEHGYLTRDQVYLNPSGKYKIPQCIECKKISTKKYLKKVPSRHRDRHQREKYEELFKIQDGKCAICKKPELSRSNHPNSNKDYKRLSLDHCHTTEEETGIFKIRGLLCQLCNTSLGGFQDSIAILESAISYLKSHE